MFEKVLSGYDPTCINQERSSSNNHNNNRAGSWRSCQRESNYVKEDVKYYANDPDDRNVKPIVYRIDMDQGGSVI